MADEKSKDEQTEPFDEMTRRQREAGPRRGIPGKGYDAGTGYGGAGGDSAYSARSSYGGQSGEGGDRMRGAYAGERYGRFGDRDAPPDTLDAVPAEPDDVEPDGPAKPVAPKDR